MRKTLLVTLTIFVAGTLSGWAFAQQRQRASLSADDYIQIQDLLWTNHWGFDFANRDNADQWASTFTPDAELQNEGPNGNFIKLIGLKEIRQMALRDASTRKLRHWTTTFSIKATPQGAKLQAYFFTMAQAPGQTTMRIGRAGRYNSDVVKTPDGWKLKRHIVENDAGVSATPAASSQQPQ